jgi:hypothetical protein
MKTCAKCGTKKEDSEFRKSSRSHDGVGNSCRSCLKKADEQYRANNESRVAASRAAWIAANPGKRNEYNASYYLANKEVIRARSAEWVSANPDRARAANKAWYEANRDHVRAMNAAWRASNPERCRANSRTKEHNRRARKRAAQGKLSAGLSGRLFTLQRGKCACGCAQLLGDNYHMDHIMPLALGGSNTDDNIQLLRKTCNQQKHAKHPVEFMQQKGFLL